ncbi:MAG: putative O-glycosylation ligase, exosortase A system-associated, partial [Nevskiales bacterium]
MGLRDLYIALIYAAFFVIGPTAPFVLTLGYLWVDTFYPQYVSPLVGQIPTSLIMGIAAIGGYVTLDRRLPPRFSFHTALVLIFAGWCTLSIVWAELPDDAWVKWDWAFKVMMFAAFLTLVLRSRVQIEAFLQVFLFAASVHMLAPGIKTMLSGSGYGRQLGVFMINAGAGMTESSYLSAASIAFIPIILYLRKHSILIPKSRLRDLGCLGLVVVAVFAAISTYARTALVGFFVVAVFLWLQSRQKILFAVCAAALAIGALAMTAESWNERIDTTANYESENSALGRILVWQWTLNYVSEHPLGGGFQSFLIDRIEFPSSSGGAPAVVYGKAFHNIFIEVLGEQGFPGLAMYVTLMLLSLGYMWSVMRRTRGQPHLLWVHDLAGALMTSLLTIMACGFFIGIAFQALVWYLMTLPVCL